MVVVRTQQTVVSSHLIVYRNSYTLNLPYPHSVLVHLYIYTVQCTGIVTPSTSRTHIVYLFTCTYILYSIQGQLHPQPPVPTQYIQCTCLSINIYCTVYRESCTFNLPYPHSIYSVHVYLYIYILQCTGIVTRGPQPPVPTLCTVHLYIYTVQFIPYQLYNANQ